MTKINKIARAVALLIMIVAMTGCGIGYNKTLFFTKTNVGLDIDSRPPTAEVTIARREGVIAPTFECGNTPPVLASFGVDVNGVAALFAGISSTFAGGDAAVTMAMLYDDSDKDVANSNYTCADFDSSFNLTKKPHYLDWFGCVDKSRKLLNEGEIEPFIFGTDTSFGLKVAWSGITAQLPDTVKLGFNRKEFALAPITLTSITNTPGKVAKVRMPSFLATIDNSTRLGEMAETKIKHLQYFATGKAADFMARRYAVRKAMISRLEPVAAISFGERVMGLGRTALVASLWQIQQVLQNTDDLRAKQLADRMDSVDLLVPKTYGFTQYRWETPEKKALITTAPTTEITTEGVQKAADYWSVLKDSRDVLKESLEFETVMVDGEEVSRAGLANEHEKVEQMYEEFDQRLLSDPDIVAAIKYLAELLK